MNFDRFRAPTAADDLQSCGGCGAKVLPEFLDRRGLCYGDCSPFEDEEDERKDENEKEAKD